MTILWAALVVSGFASVVHYSVTAAEPVSPPVHRDHENDLAAYIFIHPKCPCTRATIESLDRVLTEAGINDKGTVTAYVYEPSKADRDWSETDLVARLRKIPAVRVKFDRDGFAASTFGVMTSGHLLIYAGNSLAFSGGVTPSRGHEGNCDAANAAGAALSGQESGRSWPVFGCPILEFGSRSGDEAES
ncbi:MAG: RedB [Planctomycetota bacterium]